MTPTRGIGSHNLQALYLTDGLKQQCEIWGSHQVLSSVFENTPGDCLHTHTEFSRVTSGWNHDSLGRLCQHSFVISGGPMTTRY